MQQRYFIGITPPEDFSNKIALIQHSLMMPGKTMDPLVPHITLLDPNTLMTLPPMYFLPKVKTVAAEVLPFELEFSRLDMFDKRVLYIAIKSRELQKLQEQLANLLPESILAQYYVGRSYTAHLTLAQAKPKQVLPDDLITTFRRQIAPLLPYRFSAKQLTHFIRQSPRNYKVESI
jgi:2'-5' RNA ligase